MIPTLMLQYDADTGIMPAIDAYSQSCHYCIEVPKHVIYDTSITIMITWAALHQIGRLIILGMRIYTKILHKWS